MHILMWYFLIGLVYSVVIIGLIEIGNYKLTKEHTEEWKTMYSALGMFGIIVFLFGLNAVLWPASVGYAIYVLIRDKLKKK